jgi:hypothetical protein
MNGSPEIIGSMPSMPAQKPLQTRPSSSYTWVYVGFFLYAVCAVVFPIYANIGRMGTGIFDGMGFLILLIAIMTLSSGISRYITHRISLGK